MTTCSYDMPVAEITYIILAETPSLQLRELANELYFASHELLHACSEAILCNKAIWSRFKAGYACGIISAAVGVYAVKKGVQGVRSLASWAGMGGFAAGVNSLSVVVPLGVGVAGLGAGIATLLNTWKYDNICQSRESNSLLAPTVLRLYKLCHCHPNINST